MLLLILMYQTGYQVNITHNEYARFRKNKPNELTTPSNDVIRILFIIFPALVIHMNGQCHVADSITVVSV